jgi:hypothetical protein
MKRPSFVAVCLLLVLFSYSQKGLADSINSYISKTIKKANASFDSKGLGSFKYFSYDSAARKISSVEIFEANRPHILLFYSPKGQLIKCILFNSFRRDTNNAQYYFEDDSLVYRDGFKLTLLELNEIKQEAKKDFLQGDSWLGNPPDFSKINEYVHLMDSMDLNIRKIIKVDSLTTSTIFLSSFPDSMNNATFKVEEVKSSLENEVTIYYIFQGELLKVREIHVYPDTGGRYGEKDFYFEKGEALFVNDQDERRNRWVYASFLKMSEKYKRIVTGKRSR